MHPIIQKTFGGLSGQYLFRQYLFSFGLTALCLYMAFTSANANNHSVAISIPVALFIVNLLLYPYSLCSRTGGELCHG